VDEATRVLDQVIEVTPPIASQSDRASQMLDGDAVGLPDGHGELGAADIDPEK
jgi:hypothetical protein